MSENIHDRLIQVSLSLLPALLMCLWSSACAEADSAGQIKLSKEHVEAAKRTRRLILHYDIVGASMRIRPWGQKGIDELDEVIEYYTKPYVSGLAQGVDSVFYGVNEGYPAMWASNVIKRTSIVFPKWWAAGIDPMGVLVNETKKVGREVFITFRINGSDVEESGATYQVPEIKRQHPDWLIETPWGLMLWNFAKQGVRDHMLRV